MTKRDECQHGSLRRSCEICELEQIIREQAARIAVLENEVRVFRESHWGAVGTNRAGIRSVW